MNSKPLEVNMDVFLAEFQGHPNGVDKEGWTPLQIAVRWGYIETVKELARRGADANTLTPTGLNLIQLANAYGHTELVELSKKAGGAV